VGLFAPSSVWAVDVGQSALKAIRATQAKGGMVIEVATLVEYPQLVAASGPQRDEILEQAIDKFVERSGIKPGERVALSIPSVGTIVRYINLPPVQRSRVPEIVRYEARQQIPFPLEESIWDYELVDRHYEPGEEIEVGLFAVRRENVYNILYHFEQRGFKVELIQLAPMAVYNFVRLSGLMDTVGMVISVGAACTDIIIADNKSLLVRSLPVAGNDMTRTLQDKLRVSFIQAEKLKRRSGTVAPEQAKRMLGVMLPVLHTFVAEIQRTLGYYRSQVRSIKLQKIVAVGNGVRVRGFRQYLAKQLEIPVEPVLTLAEQLRAPNGSASEVLRKNVPAFGAAIGLAAQVFGQAENEINLVPAEITQRHVLKAKRPFAASVAACCMLAMLLMWFTANRQFRSLGGALSYGQEVVDRERAFEDRFKQLDVSPLRGRLLKIQQIAVQRRRWIDFWSKLGELLPEDLKLRKLNVQAVNLERHRERLTKPGNHEKVVQWAKNAPGDAELLIVGAAGRLRYLPGKGFIETIDRVEEIRKQLLHKPEFAGFEVRPGSETKDDASNSIDLPDITWFIIPPGWG